MNKRIHRHSYVSMTYEWMNEQRRYRFSLCMNEQIAKAYLFMTNKSINILQFKHYNVFYFTMALMQTFCYSLWWRCAYFVYFYDIWYDMVWYCYTTVCLLYAIPCYIYINNDMILYVIVWCGKQCYETEITFPNSQNSSNYFAF